MKKLLYSVLAVYTILHVAVFTHYPATPQLSQTASIVSALQWLIPTVLFVLLIPAIERIKLPIRLITFAGLAFVVVCVILSILKLPGLWWSWTTLGFITLIILLVLNETKLLSLSFAVAFLSLGSFEIIYQTGLWFYYNFFGSGLANFVVVITENLLWIVPSTIMVLILQRRYKIFKPNILSLTLFSISVICSVVWFSNSMDIPLLWWKGFGPWMNESARPLFIAISRGSQTFWILGIMTLFVDVKQFKFRATTFLEEVGELD